MKKNLHRFCRGGLGFLLAIWFFCSLAVRPGEAQPALRGNSEGLSPEAQTADASDRKYFSELRTRIAAAKIQVDAALREIAVEGASRDPVQQLLDDLIAAEQRGVRVRIFLNTFGEGEWERSLFLRDEVLRQLKRSGVQVHFVHPRYRLEDQLVILDNTWVLEGGPSWSREGLSRGLGSATLTRSEALAGQKRARLELLPLWDLRLQEEAKGAGEIPVPQYLLEDVKYFPAMLRTEDGDALRIYLDLLEKYFEKRQTRFEVSLGELATRLPGSNDAGINAVIPQVYEAFVRLNRVYGLVTVQTEEPERIEIEMKLPEVLGPEIRLSADFVHQHYLKELSPRAVIAYLILTLRAQSSGGSPVWIGTEGDVEQDFPVTREDFRAGIQELRRANLVEVFPFPLRQGEGYLGPERSGFRYLLNEIPALSERLETWSRMREDFGDDPFRRAKALAGLFGEPEDPKVVTAYLKLLTQYPYSEVESFTQHVTSLPASSTPDALHYVKELLRNETQPTTGLSLS